MAVEPNMITPFDEGRPFENVFIVGAAPDEYPWVTDKIILPYRDHANESALFYSLRGKEKWLRRTPVYIIQWNATWGPFPIDANPHIFFWRVARHFSILVERQNE